MQIPDELVKRIMEVLDDVEGLIDCNCGGNRCEGDCTYSMAVAAGRELAEISKAS